MDGHADFADGDALRAHAALVAAAVAGESGVLGVDFQNEPYTTDIAALRLNATSRETLAQRFALNLSLLAPFQAALAPGAFSTFPALADGRVPVPPGFEAFFAALSAVWGEWVSWYARAFAAAAPLTQLCVGFNTWPALLPALYGRGLTFTCSHAYADSPLGYANATAVGWVPTLLDRLAAAAAANGAPRPILLGETGSSNGQRLAPAAPPLLDFCSAAVFDAMPLLLSLARGHAGSTRWAVADVPFVYAAQGMRWLGNVSDAAAAPLYAQQGFFGLAAFDGVAPGGVPKPTAVGARVARAHRRPAARGAARRARARVEGLGRD